MKDTNGTKALLLGTLLAIALALSGWALAATVSHGERITRTEAEIDAHEKVFEGIDSRLRHIDRKLDRLLER